MVASARPFLRLGRVPAPSLNVSQRSASTEASSARSNGKQKLKDGIVSLEGTVLDGLDAFQPRHVGPRDHDVEHMLKALNCTNLEDFISEVVPPHIRLPEEAARDKSIPPLSETAILRRSQQIASQNQDKIKSFIGMGYHNAVVPPVIQRNILENPAWYTSYTPYQPEISQGRLESLVNFQTMVKSLTALDIANASLLDEATAAAEAMILAYGQSRSQRKTFLVDRFVLPQTLSVLKQRAKGFGIRIYTTHLSTRDGEHRLPPEEEVKRDDIIGCLVQYPNDAGHLNDYEGLAKEVKGHGGIVVAATDLLALTMIKPPGEWGADIALGNSGRFGVPLGFGGPHAAFFAVSDKLKRKIPGRLVGLSKDQQGKPAYRLALQTREQHIRREKATSNICTAQALLANMSAMYAVYHGPDGLRKIAARVHALTRILRFELLQMGYGVLNTDGAFFDTLQVSIEGVTDLPQVNSCAQRASVNLRSYSSERIGITLDESTSILDLVSILNAMHTAKKLGPLSEQGKAEELGRTRGVQKVECQYQMVDILRLAEELELDAKSLETLQISTAPAKQPQLPPRSPEEDKGDEPVTPRRQVNFDRTSAFMTQPVFSQYRSETEMLRYIHYLQSKDLSLVHSMIPLGSCTMKLNATSSMMPLSNSKFANIHPFAPKWQTRGYGILIEELEQDLCAITGFPAVSLQPNSGAQGEYAGLSAIRAYLDANGQEKRDVCLIPGSAHGTNPASAVMAGMRVVSVKNKQDGSLDLEDLKAKAEQHSEQLAAFMVTYPSTYGVFESSIQEACKIIHTHGGQVYMDGANLQAQIGLTNPAIIGADVTHLNLHKTFSIPHGGGGPGVGPICCAEHLRPYLPGSPRNIWSEKGKTGPVSAAPYGSASILTISWAYIKQLGWAGLRHSSAVALLSANYMAARLAPHYKLRYSNEQGRVAHEFLLDLSPFSEHVSVSDVAKRLSDYSFHAPTCSWPISTGLLIEPTESESLAELDRFIEAMISIRKEIQDVIDDKDGHGKNNVLKNAPHTMEVIAGDDWARPYSRELAAYPVPSLRTNKFWPASGRLDDVYGDSNLVCECGSVDQYAENESSSATKRP